MTHSEHRVIRRTFAGQRFLISPIRVYRDFPSMGWQVWVRSVDDGRYIDNPSAWHRDNTYAEALHIGVRASKSYADYAEYQNSFFRRTD